MKEFNFKSLHIGISKTRLRIRFEKLGFGFSMRDVRAEREGYDQGFLLGNWYFKFLKGAANGFV